MEKCFSLSLINLGNQWLRVKVNDADLIETGTGFVRVMTSGRVYLERMWEKIVHRSYCIMLNYCVNAQTGSYKLIFGSGTKLLIEPGGKYGLSLKCVLHERNVKIMFCLINGNCGMWSK